MAQVKPTQKPYIVICEPDLAKLENRVSSMILKGYKPQGSMSIQLEHNEEYYYQPMLLVRKVTA
ncbi:DUF1737 domain-containing protein [Candidatus Venteria ishoeyi]|uniref:Uncharacterized protein n=1 Tax=Candidatus Venteria ishoeyi TaxID=1899563 RepID=A0A1H6FD50_9GAMM|nr:DUF1737 domain-containing protein [Candidatus Venteria ishoeyi]MDM8546332.1 DUF1737 domain-containing protein [Candidatus Venteria ishoeyi]SEH06945.1 Uncharacterised protein [Candidatus Venteria ishoeyi]